MGEMEDIAALVKDKGFLTTKDIMTKFSKSRSHSLEIMKSMGTRLEYSYIPGSGELMTSSVIKYTPDKAENLVKKAISVFTEKKTDTVDMTAIMDICRLDFPSALELARQIAIKYPTHFKIDEPLSDNNLHAEEVFLIYIVKDEPAAEGLLRFMK